MEDLPSDFLSDGSDREAGRKSSDSDGEHDKADHQELVHLHVSNLMSFDHIYANNAIVDMQVGRRLVI